MDNQKITSITQAEQTTATPARGAQAFLSQKRGKIIVFLVALVVLLIAVRALLGKKKPGPEEEEAVVVSVKVAKVERGSISAEVTALGTIFGRREATVSSKIAGQIKQMSLIKNKPFREGDVIIRLEASDIQAQLNEAAAALQEARTNLRSVTGGSIPQTAAQDEKALRDAQANVENARALYERRKRLFEQGGISKKDVEAAQLSLTTAENDLRLADATARLHKATTSPGDRQVAEAKVKQAADRLAALDTQLSYATIRAPFSGVITDQFQYQGEFAQPGGKLFSIADTSEVIVKAPVADNIAAQLKTGETAKVLPEDLPGEELVGVISLVSRANDPQSRTVEVWVNLKNDGGRLHPNGAAKVILARQSADNVIIVPLAAVTLEASNGDEGSVMVVDENSIAHDTKVTVGIRGKDQIEVKSGLKGGETIVVEGNYALPDGAKVEVNESDGEGEGKDKETPEENEKKEKKEKKSGDER